MESVSPAIIHDARHALLAHTVDMLADVKKKIADLREEEDQLKQILIESGESAVDGTAHSASVCDITPKDKVDWETIAMRFAPSRQLIRRYTTKGESYVQVRVYSRKTSK